MRQLAREEAEQAEGEREGLLRAVLKCILPRDEADQRGCILEVRAGTPRTALSVAASEDSTVCSSLLCMSCYL